MKQLLIIIFIIILSCIISLSQPVFSESPAVTDIQKLESFARLYGYIRYFYPGDEAAETDWEKFVVHGVQRVRQAGNKAQLKRALQELFRPIAPALALHETGWTPTIDSRSLLPASSPPPGPHAVTAWQHQGISVGKPAGLFRSVRVNRPLPGFFEHAYGALINKIDAAPYRGKTIHLKAAVKVLSGQGKLWLRVEREGKEPGFFNDMDETPIQPGDWKYYTITGPVAKDARTISFGCILPGEGQLWVDDFQLNSGTAPKGVAISISNPGFESGEAGKVPSGWQSKSDGYSLTVTAGGTPEGKRGLVIKSLEPPLAKPIFDALPGFGETRTRNLGCGISCTFPLALAIIDKSTYPRASQRRVRGLREAYRHALGPENKRPDNMDEGLAGVVIVWNVLRHFYPYFQENRSDWNAALSEALASTFNDASHYDYLQTLRVLMARLNDSQAGAYMKGNTRRMFLPPIAWDWRDGQLVITDVYQPDKTSLEESDIVVDVNGLLPEDVLSRQEREISGATPGWKRYRALEELLRGKQNSQLRIKVKRKGHQEPIGVTLVRSLFSPKYYGFKEKRKKKSGWIAKGKYYINLDITPRKALERIMPELQKAREILCDLKGSPKDNPPLICHFLESSQVLKMMYVPQVIYPDFENPGFHVLEWHLPALKPHLDAKLTLISGHGVSGQGELILRAAKHLKIGKIDGRASAGTAGSTNSFYLFGRYFITWTNVKTVEPGGNPSAK